MKKLFLALIAFASFAASAQNDAVMSDANAQKRSLSGSFTAITVSDGIDLYLSQGNEESVAVSASDNKYLDRFKTEVINGTLKIYYDDEGISRNSDKRKLKAYVSFKTIEKLHGSAGAEVVAKSSLSLGNFDMSFSSGSSFKGKLSAKQLSIEQSSGSAINISGSAEKITASMSSGASLRGYDMAVDYCDAKASSGAELHITINKELNAKASSGGEIRYKGEALIRDISISGGGTVKRS